MPAVRTSPQLSPSDIAALQAFSRFYGPRRASIVERVRAKIGASPTWGPVFEHVSLEHIEAQQTASFELHVRGIFDGDWAPYLASMRAHGSGYARAGVSFSAWFELIHAFRDSIHEQLAAASGEPQQDVATSLTISRGLDALIHVVNQQFGEAYVEATQQEVVRSEALHRAMFEHSPLPMWTYDRETLRFLTVNEAALRHYGYTREELSTMTIADIRPAEDVEALRAEVARARGYNERKVWRHRKKDGTVITVEVRANDLVVDGTSVRLALIHDITERVRAEEALRQTEDQLRHAQKMEAIGRLAGSVAHDFNNVLTVVQSYACLLEDSIAPADPRREEAAEIRRAAERASGITRQLLTLSRRSIVTPRAVELAALIEGFLPLLRRLVGEDVQVVTHCARTPEVIADPGQLEQVLMNLAVNARDAMPGGGRLTIECGVLELDEHTAQLHGVSAGSFVELAVSDTGIGMDAETQTRIFEPFYTTKGANKGTGLGLSIAHGIVTQAGGRIVVYSEPDHGTTFRVQLPVAAHHHEAADEAPQLTVPSTLPPLRILIVDDQPEVRSVAARILQAAGCSVLVAGTAEEARTIWVRHEEPIDLVLLDVVLSDGRGDALAHELREIRPEVTFVLMSGYSAGALTGATAEVLLPKPFTPSQLRAAVSRALGGVARASTPTPSGFLRARHCVLVADDDDVLRRSVVRLLRRENFEVVDVDTGAKAIAELESSTFDVIVSDVQMPEADGLEVLRAARRVDLELPVILLTGQPTVEAAATAVEYGAFRYLTKPLEGAALVSCVNHAARAHALARIRREAFSVAGAHVRSTDRAGLEERFVRALDRMWMAFQPVVHASNGAVFGVEALIRSDEPSLPWPPALLDAATQLGRLPHLGRRARSLASAALTHHPTAIDMFVNLHPEDLHDADLVDETSPLARIASRVILEVTERTALASSTQLTERIARLRQLGFRLAVDDIGAGYSGLTSFTELAPEVVKIDLSLVRGVHESALKQRTIAALCRLCHESGTLVVAEGVETRAERETLVALGCDLLQGYLFGRPERELP